MKKQLDARFLSDKATAHAYLKEQLQFPEYYGNNLDALYDCLTDLKDLELILTNADDIESEEARACYERFLEVLCDACLVTVVDSAADDNCCDAETDAICDAEPDTICDAAADAPCTPVAPILGQPRFRREQRVSFELEGETIDGVIYIVDAYGTFEQNEEPSYDIEAFYNGQVVLFKHIRESWVSERK